MKYYLLLALFLTACGDGGSSIPSAIETANITPSWALQPLRDEPSLWAALGAASPLNGNCPRQDSGLAGHTWNLISSKTFDSYGILNVKTDCSFETSKCGAVGYLISDAGGLWTGIAKLNLVGFLSPNTEGCAIPGTYTCGYSRDGSDGLRLDCDLIQKNTEAFSY